MAYRRFNCSLSASSLLQSLPADRAAGAAVTSAQEGAALSAIAASVISSATFGSGVPMSTFPDCSFGGPSRLLAAAALLGAMFGGASAGASRMPIRCWPRSTAKPSMPAT